MTNEGREHSSVSVCFVRIPWWLKALHVWRNLPVTSTTLMWPPCCPTHSLLLEMNRWDRTSSPIWTSRPREKVPFRSKTNNHTKILIRFSQYTFCTYFKMCSPPKQLYVFFFLFWEIENCSFFQLLQLFYFVCQIKYLAFNVGLLSEFIWFNFFIHRSAKKDCAHELRICSYSFNFFFVSNLGPFYSHFSSIVATTC